MSSDKQIVSYMKNAFEQMTVQMTDSFVKAFEKLESKVDASNESTTTELVTVNNRLTNLEENQFVDLNQADALKYAAQARVAELLEIKWDPRGGVTDKSKHNYKYFSRFCGRIHTDARHAGLEGPRIYATPRKNFDKCLEFYAQWKPLRTVDGLKSYYDSLQEA